MAFDSPVFRNDTKDNNNHGKQSETLGRPDGGKPSVF
jgi:hypothetical protein